MWNSEQTSDFINIQHVSYYHRLHNEKPQISYTIGLFCLWIYFSIHSRNPGFICGFLPRITYQTYCGFVYVKSVPCGQSLICKLQSKWICLNIKMVDLISITGDVFSDHKALGWNWHIFRELSQLSPKGNKHTSHRFHLCRFFFYVCLVQHFLMLVDWPLTSIWSNLIMPVEDSWVNGTVQLVEHREVPQHYYIRLGGRWLISCLQNVLLFYCNGGRTQQK